LYKSRKGLFSSIEEFFFSIGKQNANLLVQRIGVAQEEGMQVPKH
jgi:hypothetical protein